MGEPLVNAQVLEAFLQRLGRCFHFPARLCLVSPGYRIPPDRPRNVTNSVTKLLNVNLRPVPASADRFAEFSAFPCPGQLCYNPIITGNVPMHSANSRAALTKERSLS
jgi:hypothetical protein